jgi:DNA-binding NarL/FixJ family response regulator
MAMVLIVDDEPDIVLFVRVNMEMDGHDVLTAGDGEAALAAVAEHHPDVIILDVMMPKLDGWSVLEQLKADADPLVRTIPVVMLTALGTDDDQARGGIEGAVRYLPKPVTPDALVDAVNGVLEGGPEPEQRKAAQHQALRRLARIERGSGGTPFSASAPRPRLGGLERAPSNAAAAPSAPAIVLSLTGALTEKQRHLLQVLQLTPSVSAAAEELGMSRSNIYASLRRIGRKLDVDDVSELLRRLRDGELDTAVPE